MKWRIKVLNTILRLYIEISIKVLLKTCLYLHKQLNKINSDYLHHAVIGKFGTRVSAEHVNGKDKPAQ